MDHSITVAPGSEFPVQAAGDFVFCKFADRDIRVIIQNSPRTMRAGSKWRPAGGFEAGDVIVQNPDPVNPVAVVLTIGTGDFDDQIIRGDVTVTPVLRTADGTTVPDSRRTIEFMVNVTKSQNVAWENGELKTVLIASGGTVDQRQAAAACVTDQYLVTASPNNSADTLNYFSLETGELLESVNVMDIPEPIFPNSPTPAGEIKDLAFNRWRGTVWYLSDVGVAYELVGRGPGIIRAIDVAAMTSYPASEQYHDIWGGLTWINESTVAIVNRWIQGSYPTGSIHIVDIVSGRELRVIEPDERPLGSIEYVNETGELFVRSGGNQVVAVPAFGATSGRVVGEAAVSVVANASRREWGTWENNASRLELYSAADVSYYAVGSVRGRECGAGAVLMKPQHMDVESAIFSVPVAETGRVRVSGELIRSILEMYGGGLPSDDYLDSVYAFEVPGQGVSQGTGGSSFAAAGVDDYFVIESPAVVRLTVDNRLNWR